MATQSESSFIGKDSSEPKCVKIWKKFGNKTMADQSEGSTDSELLGNKTDESEGSTDSELLGNTTDESEGSTDSELLGNTTDESEGSTDSELSESMATQSESSFIGKDSSEPKCVKILVLGEAGIGKTTLIKSYISTMIMPVEKLENEELDVFEIYPLRIKYNENVVDLRFIDLRCWTNSPERRQCYPVDVNVIILCFSIGNYHTLKSVYNLWIHEVRSHFGKVTPVLMVGLKRDRRFVEPFTHGTSMLCQEENRVVEKCEAEVIHKKYKFQRDYMECSVYYERSLIQVIENAILVALKREG